MALFDITNETLSLINEQVKPVGAAFAEIDDFTEGWEGGLTDDLEDNASAFPVPGTYTKIKKGKKHTSSHWHTNKGVTWATFKKNGQKLGYNPTPELFFLMPKDIWLKIAKFRYWDVLYLDQYQSQAVANLMFSWQWGSGYGWRNRIQNYLKSKNIFWKTSDIKGLMTIFNSLAKANEAKLFNELIEQKLQYLKSLSDWPRFGKGWTNRLNDLKSKSIKFISENKAAATGGGLFFLAATAAAIYLLSKKNNSKPEKDGKK